MFFLRYAPVPAPKVHRESKDFFFCATRLVPAPKVHRESKEKFLFCATRLVQAPKVHRGSNGKNFFALRALCPRLRFTGEARIFFRYALESRKLCVSLGVNKVKNVPSLCATECNN